MRPHFRAGIAGLVVLALVGFAVPSAAAASGEPKPASAASAPKASVMRSVAAPGFDTCEAPSVAAMEAWRASPYKAVGIYVGGANRACANAGLTQDWVRQVHAQGWDFLPVYVGAQASCTASTKAVRIDPARSWDMGREDADDAVDRAAALGLKEGSALYFDMEGYDNRNADCSRDVLNFVSAWTLRVHERGYVAGYYSSLDSGIEDVLKADGTRLLPDALWYARWDDRAVTSGDGAIPDGAWLGRRVHQYAGNVKETYGGVAITIDRNELAGPVAVL